MELIELAKTKAWWLAARDRVKEVIDGPDLDIDRIILGVLDNDGTVPEALASDYCLAIANVKRSSRCAVSN